MEAVIAAGAQDVETPLTQGRIPGDMCGGAVSTAVHIPIKPSAITKLSTPAHHRDVPLNIKGEALLCT